MYAEVKVYVKSWTATVDIDLELSIHCSHSHPLCVVSGTLSAHEASARIANSVEHVRTDCSYSTDQHHCHML